MLWHYSCWGGVAQAEETKKDVTEIDSVVVKGSKVEPILEDIPDEKIIITAEEIAMHNPQNVLEAIQWVPGFTLQGTFYGHGTGDPKVLGGGEFQRLNGYSGALLVLIDGISAYGDQPLAEMSANNIERIELIKGANSLAYGSGATGGVINIITKKGTDKISANLKGSYSIRKQNVRVGSKYEKQDFKSHTQDVGIGFTLGNVRQRYAYGRQFVEGDAYRSDTFSGKFGVDLDNNIRLGLDAKVKMNEQKWTKHTEDDYSGRLNMDWGIDPYSSLKVSVLLRNGKMKYNMWGLKVNEDRLYNEEKLTYTRQIEQNLLTVGYQRTGDNIDFSDLRKWSKNQDVNSLFIADDFVLTDSISILPAIRIDYHSKWKEHFSPKLGILWKATDSLKFRASWGRGLRVPSLDQLYQKIYHPHGYWYDGNPELRPEESDTMRFGVENKFGQDVWASVAFYRNEFTNNIGLKETSKVRKVKPVYEYKNNKRAMTQGVDANFRYYITNTLSASLGYSWTEGKNRYTGESLENIIKHRFSPMLRYHNELIGFTAEVRGEYQMYPSVSKRDKSKGIKKENYSLHAGCSQTVTDYAKVWLNGYNLLNETKKYGLESDGLKIVFGLEVKY